MAYLEEVNLLHMGHEKIVDVLHASFFHLVPVVDKFFQWKSYLYFVLGLEISLEPINTVLLRWN